MRVFSQTEGEKLVDGVILKLLTTRVFTSVCPLLVKSLFGRRTRRPGSDGSVGELTTSSYELLLVYLFTSYRLSFTIRDVMKVSTRCCPTLASLELTKGEVLNGAPADKLYCLMGQINIFCMLILYKDNGAAPAAH